MTPEQEYDVFTELLWRELHPEHGPTYSPVDCKHEHGSGIMDTNGNGEFTCHTCGHVQKFGRGMGDDRGPNG